MRSISIVLEKKKSDNIEFWTWNSLSLRKHYFQRLVVKDLKFSTCFSIYDFEFAFSELSVKDSTTNRRSCERFIWTRFSFLLRWFAFFYSTFADNFVKLSRCVAKFIFFVYVSSSSLFQRTFHFRRAWSQKKDLFTKRRSLSSAEHTVESFKRKLQLAQHN
jgi:hypothetical protein